QAEYNYERIKGRVHVQIRRETRNLDYASELEELAEQALAFRRESLRMSTEAGEAGLKTTTEVTAARAELAKAEVDLLKARLNRRLAVIRLRKVCGYPVRDGH
ncbi:hypothetical protein DRQ50_06000, partial [bacterium]